MATRKGHDWTDLQWAKLEKQPLRIKRLLKDYVPKQEK